MVCLVYLKVTIWKKKKKKSKFLMDSVTALFYGTDGLLEEGILFPFLELHFIIFGNGNLFLLFNIFKYHCSWKLVKMLATMLILAMLRDCPFENSFKRPNSQCIGLFLKCKVCVRNFQISTLLQSTSNLFLNCIKFKLLIFLFKDSDIWWLFHCCIYNVY